jgi:hypothetical protein
MSTEIPLALRDKWIASSAGIRYYKAQDFLPSWEQTTCSVLEGIFSPTRINDIPIEFIEIHLNLDELSVQHLWVKTFMGNRREISVGQLRLLIDIVFEEQLSLKLTPSEYSKWVSELLLLLNANESTGSVSAECFLKLFPLWFCSRDFGLSKHRNIVSNIIEAWSFLDVSNCKVLSVESVSRWLLPFAYRCLMPQSKNVDQDQLKQAWLDMMPAKNFVRKTDWISHWSEFANLNPLAFAEDLGTPERVRFVAEEAIRSLDSASDGGIDDLKNLLSLVPDPSKQTRSRIFGLWIVTLRPNKRRSGNDARTVDRICDPIPLIPSSNFQAICSGIWAKYLGSITDSRIHVFHDWYNTLVAALKVKSYLLQSDDDFIVRRDRFCSPFFTDQELETLWDTFSVADKSRIKPGELRRMLQRIYRSSSLDVGPWIAEQWLNDFVQFCHELELLSETADITKDIFMSAFPIFFAAAQDNIPKREENEAAAQVWPATDTASVIYSETVLGKLFQDVWELSVPKRLNIPCQEWWIERCLQRISENGKGITRSDFVNLFLAKNEMDEILYRVSDPVDLETLSRILAVGNRRGIDEFFLMIDINVATTDGEKLASVSREAFRIAFPLWFVAHSTLPINS